MNRKMIVSGKLTSENFLYAESAAKQNVVLVATFTQEQTTEPAVQQSDRVKRLQKAVSGQTGQPTMQQSDHAQRLKRLQVGRLTTLSEPGHFKTDRAEVT